MDARDVLAAEDKGTLQIVAGQAFDELLASIRMKHPFLVIVPYPDKVVSVVLGANVAQDIAIPSGTMFVKFSGRAGKDFWVSRNGAAVVPAVNATNSAESLYDSGCIINPDKEFYFVGRARNVSVISDVANIVSMACYMQE